MTEPRPTPEQVAAAAMTRALEYLRPCPPLVVYGVFYAALCTLLDLGVNGDRLAETVRLEAADTARAVGRPN
jgi:hypothetical protein